MKQIYKILRWNSIRMATGIAIMLVLFANLAGASPNAYITNVGDDNVSVIDTATNTVIATVSVGNSPSGVAVNQLGTRVYVANTVSNDVSVIDTATNTVIATVPVGSDPEGVAVNPAGTMVYVTNYGNKILSVINTTTNTVIATVPVGNPYGVVVNPDGTKVYVANGFTSQTVSVIDAANNTVDTTIPVGNEPIGIAINPSGTKIYVANQHDSTVSVIDTATNTVVATVTLGLAGQLDSTQIAINPTGTKVYVTDFHSNNVSVIDTTTNTVIATIPVGDSPWGVAVSPTGTYVYVANVVSNNVSVIDTASNTVMASVNVGLHPQAVGQFIGPLLTGSISGKKFNDSNGNGVQDPGEPTIAGWTINLKDSNGNLIAATNTDSSGNYTFPNLVAGTYIVDEGIKGGWITTEPSSGNYTVIVVPRDEGTENVVGKDFGNFKLGEIHGSKFEDLNANGIKDTGETGLQGWQININGTDTITNTLVNKTIATDINGDYNFTGLTNGTYVVTEINQAGWIQSSPATGNYTVIITSGANITEQDFGNFHKGKITGGGWINITGDPKATFGIIGQYPDSKTAQGNVEYHDHEANLDIKSIQINTVVTTLDKKKGTITGLASVNGKGSYPFVVYVENNGEPGRGIDVFKISLPIYTYSNGDILAGGNIQING